ncbi:carboxymuconolactone decarboxylase family protein [Leucobacter aridicollis]|uniref:Putative peroxidase-related enzyme n=1 Tax=Leucobacter aridicollis TaxID=283878 RepID=A0A852R0Q1_9MICO|nr:peroxidase-related enzyme [Leucobacter aridicollis]MBL3682689.1 carboxymuconolactone decarboxylase [Leucobacter aridicollis]NYD26127.1 putative peroxidase-related enzyme [Leucobacter aridicollis]
MARVPVLTTAEAAPAAQANLAKVEKAFGTIPNMFAAVANSPAALQSMWGSFGAFSTGALGAALTEQIAVAVADTNDCAYCLAAHTALGQQAGLSPEELATAQRARAADPKTEALLQFAHSLVERRGKVDPQQLAGLRDLGWTDSQIVETIAQVGLNLFTNYINIALDVPVDFPEVPFQRG